MSRRSLCLGPRARGFSLGKRSPEEPLGTSLPASCGGWPCPWLTHRARLLSLFFFASYLFHLDRPPGSEQGRLRTGAILGSRQEGAPCCKPPPSWVTCPYPYVGHSFGWGRWETLILRDGGQWGQLSCVSALCVSQLS